MEMCHSIASNQELIDITQVDGVNTEDLPSKFPSEPDFSVELNNLKFESGDESDEFLCDAHIDMFDDINEISH